MNEFWFNWNNIQIDWPLPKKSPTWEFFDETLRDGIQAPYIATPSLDSKFQLIDHMALAGIRCADFGFPGSGPAAAAQCRKIAAYIAASGYEISQGYAGRSHSSDIDAICTLAQSVGVSVDAYIFIGASPIRQRIENWDLDSIVTRIRSAARACEHGDVEFVLVLEDTTRCTPDALERIYDTALDLGVRRITLCDTVGASRPHGTKALIGWSARYFTEHGHSVGFEWHGHNDRGLGLINSLTALAAGCERVHGTVLGVGERAGNTSIDQLIVNSHLDGRAEHDLIALRQYCEYASNALGVSIPNNYPAMGRDVFTTSAGVHASAILKAHEKSDLFGKDSIYSSVPASKLGREQEVLIDSSSGASNVRYWLTIRGLQADETAIQHVLDAAKTRSFPLNDDEIGKILAARP
jgi:2-isopropylmalate synthase